MSHHATDVTEHTERDATTQASSAGGCHVSAPTRDFLSSFAIVAGGCAALLLIVREPCVVSSGAVLWIAILWLASLGLGQLCRGAGLPPLLGSLVAGLALRNGVDAFDLPPRFGALIEHVGLCVILLMSSTDIDVHAVARAGGIALRLTFLPGLVEAAACAGAAHWLFDMPPAFALSLGFLLAAVSPAIVMPGMVRLQRAGFGVAQGIPSIVMAACAMDDVVAITGYTICIGVALDERSHGASAAALALSAFLHGPVALCLGAATGGVGGLALAATRFCPRAWQRAALALELALLITYGYKWAGFEGSGPVA